MAKRQSESEDAVVMPLRKRTREGATYVRRDVVEAEIAGLGALSEAELVARCQLGRGQAGYVSSEAVLNFVRARRAEGDTPAFKRLYEVLVGRILRAFPRADGADGQTVSLSKTLVRERAFDRF